MRREVRECNPGRRLRRRIGVGTIRDISIKHDIKHVVSVPLKSNGSPLAGHVDLMPGPRRLQTRDGGGAARAENWRARPGGRPPLASGEPAREPLSRPEHR
jgi:hypothetical protein